MQLVAVPVFGLAMVTLLMAMINLLVFLRRRSLHLHLYLALACLGIAIYDITCVGLYQSADLASGAAWQRAQIVTLALVGPVVIRFVVLHTGFDWPWITRFVSIAAVVLALVGAVERHGLLLSTEPAVKHVTLPIFGPMTYHELEAGPVFMMFLVIVAVELVFFFFAGRALWRSGRRSHAIPFMVAVGLFFTSIISDALVTAGVHVAPYLTEYGFTAMIILTGLLLTDEFLHTAALEEALQQSRRLESLGRLAGGVAHDLNNYLTPIMGFSEIVMDQLEPGSQAHEDLQRVQTGTMRAAALTQQLLAFGRRQDLDPTVTSIDGVVRDLEPLLRRLLSERVELQLELDAGRAAIRVDVGQIEQMILNLATNARDAMPDGGRLRLRSAAYARKITLEIIDEGCGMTADLIERAFDPFYTTKAPGEGTGLGLAQVHGIVEQHGGHIDVSSAVGLGTSICLSLPRCKASIPVVPQSAIGIGSSQPRAAATGNRGRVLIVDDEESVRRMAGRAMSMDGFEVVGAAGVVEARQRAQTDGPFDLLICDLLLEDGTGLDVAADVTRACPSTAVLMISGIADNLSDENHSADHEYQMLRKPFSIGDLCSQARAVLDAAKGVRA